MKGFQAREAGRVYRCGGSPSRSLARGCRGGAMLRSHAMAEFREYYRAGAVGDCPYPSSRSAASRSAGPGRKVTTPLAASASRPAIHRPASGTHKRLRCGLPGESLGRSCNRVELPRALCSALSNAVQDPAGSGPRRRIMSGGAGARAHVPAPRPQRRWSGTPAATRRKACP